MMYQRVYIMAELCKGLTTKIDYVFNRISVTLIDSNGSMIQKMIKVRYGLSFYMFFLWWRIYKLFQSYRYVHNCLIPNNITNQLVALNFDRNLFEKEYFSLKIQR